VLRKDMETWSQIRELLLGEGVSFTDELSGETQLRGRKWSFRYRGTGGQWRREGQGLTPVTGSWPEVRQALFDHLRGKDPHQ